jgi:hypothetical protein
MIRIFLIAIVAVLTVQLAEAWVMQIECNFIGVGCR